MKNEPIIASRNAVRFQQESLSGLRRNRCPFSARITVRFQQEHCPESAGIAVRIGQEYAVLCVGYSFYLFSRCEITAVVSFFGLLDRVAYAP